MNFTEFFVKRPVFSSVITLVILLLGFICKGRLPVMSLPKVEIPSITVEANYPGASPDVMESQITKHLESAFGTIQGLDYMQSSSGSGTCKIHLNFFPGRTIDSIASDVRDKIFQLGNKLPRDLATPTVNKHSSDDRPVLILVFNSDKLPVNEIRDYVEKYLKSRIEVVDGVAGVEVWGGSELAMRVFLDPQKLAAYNLSTADVTNAISYQSVQKPGGILYGKDRQYALNVIGELVNEKQFDDIIITNQDGKHIYLKDIGTAKMSPKEKTSTFLFDGKESVGVSISKSSVANPLDVVYGVKKIMPEMRRLLPAAMQFKVAMDDTVYIEKSINTVFRTIFEAILLVTMVVFLFLWSVRGVIIPLVTIPVSLVGSFIFLYAFNFSINNVTLLALVLAIGLVVDDAIVVLENVHRYLEKGCDAMQAAIDGTKEITFAIIAMTITLAAVYAPIGLTPGVIGKTFTEFAVALSSAVILSGVVALTLSPMMCSKLLVPGAHKNKRHSEILLKIDNFYGNILSLAMEFRWIIVSIGIIVSIIGATMATYFLQSEDFPNEDYGTVPFAAYGPTSASFLYMVKYAHQMDDILAKIPEADLRYIKVDNKISGHVTLVDWNLRKRQPKDIALSLKSEFDKVIGVRPLSSAGGGDKSARVAVELYLTTAIGLEYLQKQAKFFGYYLYKYGGDLFDGIESTPTTNAQEYAITIDRERASSLGVQVVDIAGTIETLFRGIVPTKVKHKGNKYDVFVTLPEDMRNSIESLDNIYIKGRTRNSENGSYVEKMFALRDVIYLEKRQAPVSITHYKQMLSWDFFIILKDGVGIDAAINKINEIKAAYMPSDINVEYASATKTYIENRQLMFFILFMALAFIFLVLAAQFESFVDPLIILFSVPLSMSGAVIVLSMIPGGTLNIYSKIGLVTLIGLITKHGIMIVDFANHIRDAQGKERLEAVKDAAMLRLRPILMTTFAMVLGAVPLAFSSGAGAEARKQIGYVIVGGMSLGTLFTLFFVPVIYTFLSRTRTPGILKKIGKMKNM